MESIDCENRIAEEFGLAQHAVVIEIARIVIANQFGRRAAMCEQELKCQSRRLIGIGRLFKFSDVRINIERQFTTKENIDGPTPTI